MTNKLLFSVCMLMLLIATNVQGRKKESGDSKQASEIRAVLDKQVEAWNRRDLEAFMDGYWRTEQLTFYSGGAKTNGWQATIDRYRRSYQSEGREMGTLDFSDLQIEILGPRSAFVRGKWHLKMKSSEPGGLFTLIFRKFDNGWKIIHDHTSSTT